jgi:hypothetical protein
MLSNKIRGCQLETATLSQIPRKIDQRSLSQSAEGLQSASVGQSINCIASMIDKTSTVGSWKYQPKIGISLLQRTKAIFEQSDNYADPEFLRYLSSHKTHRRIAELGADNKTYRYTLEWLDRLRTVVADSKMWWNEPLINLSFDSEVVFEWWHGINKLTVYILEDTAEYIKVWGSDIDNEMEDGSATSPAEIMALWKWLVL